jgi:DeoR/GlpR family transcriptional regulator of sugar metabolism
VSPRQTFFIDGGTTNLELVRHLPLDLSATIITHSPTIATALEPFPSLRVILIGGSLMRHSMVATGAAALDAISRIRADLFFLGVTGLHTQEGLTTGDYEEAQIKSAIAARSAEVVSLVTTEKIGATSAYRIALITALSTLIVDREAKLPRLGNGGPAIIRAK